MQPRLEQTRLFGSALPPQLSCRCPAAQVRLFGVLMRLHWPVWVAAWTLCLEVAVTVQAAKSLCVLHCHVSFATCI